MISLFWCRALAELVGRKDAEVEWTFLGLFKSRFMLPQYRDAYIQGMTRPVVHAPVAEKPAVPVG